MAGLAAVARRPRRSRRGAADDEPVTFTVGLTNEVDSFNPFNGIEADVVRDVGADVRLHGRLLRQGHVARCRRWRSRGRRRDDGLTWTFHIRDGVKWTDGEPLTADDIAYTYNRILDGGPEAATWGSYLTSVERSRRPTTRPSC